ncbi:MAG: hypothetical protein WAV13_08365 [Thermodesulfovibrionales bacterium]
MMHRSNNDFLEFMYKPFCIIILLFGLFGMVWLRAGVVSISYDLRNLEEKKMEALKDRKMLLADRSKVISLANISSTLQSQGQRQDNGDYKRVSSGYVFPDRVKVIHVKKRTGPETYKASLEIKK